jgi:hypothetical protein
VDQCASSNYLIPPIVLGDFNARIGKFAKGSPDNCVSQYGRRLLQYLNLSFGAPPAEVFRMDSQVRQEPVGDRLHHV